MHPSWKQESDLIRQLESQQNSRSINFALTAGYRDTFRSDDLVHLDQTIRALENVPIRALPHHEQYATRFANLLRFLRHVQNDLPLPSPEQIFDRTQPLIQGLLWLPVEMLQPAAAHEEVNVNVTSLAVLAQFFGAGLALDSLFSEVGVAYLGTLSVGSLEDIFRVVASVQQKDPFHPELQLALSLLQLPRHLLARYRDRLKWGPASSCTATRGGGGGPVDRHSRSSSSSSSESQSYAGSYSISRASSPFMPSTMTAPALSSSTHLLPPVSRSSRSSDHLSASPQSSTFDPLWADEMPSSRRRMNAQLGLSTELEDGLSQLHFSALPSPTSSVCWM